jgi:hypothetical protein
MAELAPNPAPAAVPAPAAAAEGEAAADDRRPAASDEPSAKRFCWDQGDSDEEEISAPKWTRGLIQIDEISDYRIKISDRVYQVHQFLLRRDSKFFESAIKWSIRNASSTKNSANIDLAEKSTSAETHTAQKKKGAKGKNASKKEKQGEGKSKVVEEEKSKSSGFGAANDFEMGGMGVGENNDIAHNKNDTAVSDITDLLPTVVTENPAVFEHVLNFIYSTKQNDFVIPADAAFYMFKIADILGMKNLFKRCATALELYSCCYPLQLLEQGEHCCLPAEDKNLVDLNEMCTEIVIEMFQGLTYTDTRREKVFRLPLEMQKKILQDSELGVVDEDVVFKYVLAYYKWRSNAGGQGIGSDGSNNLRNGDSINGNSVNDNASSNELSLWECVRWSELSDFILADCSVETAQNFVGGDVLAKYVLPEMRNRIRPGRGAAEQMTVGAQANSSTQRLPFKRYDGRETFSERRFKKIPRCYRFYLDLICSSPHVGQILWGGVRKASEKFARMGLNRGDFSTIVSLPEVDDVVVSKEFRDTFESQLRLPKEERRWKFPQEIEGTSVGAFKWNVALEPSAPSDLLVYLLLDTVSPEQPWNSVSERTMMYVGERRFFDHPKRTCRALSGLDRENDVLWHVMWNNAVRSEGLRGGNPVRMQLPFEKNGSPLLQEKRAFVSYNNMFEFGIYLVERNVEKEEKKVDV